MERRVAHPAVWEVGLRHAQVVATGQVAKAHDLAPVDGRAVARVLGLHLPQLIRTARCVCTLRSPCRRSNARHCTHGVGPEAVCTPAAAAGGVAGGRANAARLAHRALEVHIRRASACVYDVRLAVNMEEANVVTA